MKKPIEKKLEFYKFIKSLYSNSIQLNFSEYFIINYIDGNIEIKFPKISYSRIYGIINLDDALSFKEWITKKESSVKISNIELDQFRKAKVRDVLDIEITEDEYKIKYLVDDNETYFNLIRESALKKNPELEYKYSLEIPKEHFDNINVLTIYKNGENLSINHSENIVPVLENPIKNINVIFKTSKDEDNQLKYKFFLTEEDDVGISICMLEGKNKNITLQQYFKII